VPRRLISGSVDEQSPPTRPKRLAPPSPPLADDAIRLEPLDERHVADFEGLIDDPEVLRNTRVPSTPPNGFAAKWIGRYTKGWQDGSSAGFAILSDDGAFLGFAAIVDLDLPAREGEIGYVVAPEARGRGVAGRALRLVTDWALGALGLERVELRIDVANEPSIRVAERAGYRREGVLRSLYFKEGVRTDCVLYSMLPGDARLRPDDLAASATPPPLGGG
jgi:RimJ/RimL family protein N-acetyltransferase